MFNERTGSLSNDLQYPTDVVMLVVLWRIRYKLSLRDLAEMFLVRGYAFSHETVRTWEALRAALDGTLARQTAWTSGEVVVRGRNVCEGQRALAVFLYRAIDRDGNLVDTRLSPTRDLVAAKAFFKHAVTHVGHKPERVTTDKHASYPHAIRHSLGRQVGSVNNQSTSTKLTGKFIVNVHRRT